MKKQKTLPDVALMNARAANKYSKIRRGYVIGDKVHTPEHGNGIITEAWGCFVATDMHDRPVMGPDGLPLIVNGTGIFDVRFGNQREIMSINQHWLKKGWEE